ncbi:hypothetical protein KCP77_13915 [Salmonella enterica subsp. enterica]|nr:hypothetical protein KCP77_13915 [Salmonella enterica subsp. enterica]
MMIAEHLSIISASGFTTYRYLLSRYASPNQRPACACVPMLVSVVGHRTPPLSRFQSSAGSFHNQFTFHFIRCAR